jgi:hypothetical protein
VARPSAVSVRRKDKKDLISIRTIGGVSPEYVSGMARVLDPRSSLAFSGISSTGDIFSLAISCLLSMADEHLHAVSRHSA